MRAVDTSVAVAALAGWHEAHEVARRAAADAAIPAHARVETFSVLTRLPPPHRFAAEVAADLIARWFPPDDVLVPSDELSRTVVERCHEASIDGGSVYDALVAMTVAGSGRTLLTRDDRAAGTYRRLGVDFELLG